MSTSSTFPSFRMSSQAALILLNVNLLAALSFTSYKLLRAPPVEPVTAESSKKKKSSSDSSDEDSDSDSSSDSSDDESASDTDDVKSAKSSKSCKSSKSTKDEDTKGEESKVKAEKKEKKRYKVTEQIWSKSNLKWETRKKSKDSKKSKNALFKVMHRSQENSEGYTWIEVYSKPIRNTLRKFCSESEDIFEDDPGLNGRDLFLARQQIIDYHANKTADLEKKRLEEPVPEVKTEDTSLPVIEAATPAEDSLPLVELAKEEVDDDDDEPKVETVASLEELVDHLSVLIKYMETEHASLITKLDRLKARNEISFKLLWTFFKPGDFAVTTQSSTGEKMAYKVRRCYYFTNNQGTFFNVFGEYIVWNGEKFIFEDASCAIPQFKGLRKISALPVSHLTDKMRAQLIARGRMYTAYTQVQYRHYIGTLIQPGPDPGTFIKRLADGRVMVDMKNFRRMMPNLDVWQHYDSDDDYEDSEDGMDDRPKDGLALPVSKDEEYTNEQLMLFPPSVRGFSFVHNDWGELHLMVNNVDSFSPVKFDTHAFEHLELDADHKNLIRALVEANRGDTMTKGDGINLPLISDVVSGKGGGLVICCHGMPGVGKTLTAEATAELLERPLYVQGAGELGVNASQLENRLRETFDIANSWNAVVLIDEADVFLEARSDHEISRNAIVSTFLRTLEYQRNVLFLTTNRVRSFDEAFISRISVAIKYPNLSLKTRKQLWIKFLALAGCKIDPTITSSTPRKRLTNGVSSPTSAPGTPASISTPSTPATPASPAPPLTPSGPIITARELDSFAEYKLNGRVIKQTVRTAQALAISEKKALNAQHLETVLRIHERFSQDFESAHVDYQNSNERREDRSHSYL